MCCVYEVYVYMCVCLSCACTCDRFEPMSSTTDKKRTVDRARGVILGLMAGDALGAAVEGWPADEIRRFAETQGWVDGLVQDFVEAVHMGTYVAGSEPGDLRVCVSVCVSVCVCACVFMCVYCMCVRARTCMCVYVSVFDVRRCLCGVFVCALLVVCVCPRVPTCARA
jgi:hypothetical protein